MKRDAPTAKNYLDEHEIDTLNRIVADMAAAVLVVHASPGSKIEALSLELLAAGKSLYTFYHPANAALIQAGARPIIPETNWQRNLVM